MPNYVKNIIQFGRDIPEDKFIEFMQKVTTDTNDEDDRPMLPARTGSESTALAVQDFSNKTFDFNKIVPMPESLKITEGTETDMSVTLVKSIRHMSRACSMEVMNTLGWPELFVSRTKDALKIEYKAYAKYIHPDTAPSAAKELYVKSMQRLNYLYDQARNQLHLSDWPVHTGTPICQKILINYQRVAEQSHLMRELKAHNLDPALPTALEDFVKTNKGKKLYEIGEIALDNEAKYGAMTWYNWCINNWGTKWNAGDCEIDIKSRRMEFTTAWSSPNQIAVKIAKLFPEIGFVWEYADEDTGCNTGLFTHEADSTDVSITEHENCSNEAYQAYVNCWGPSNCMYKDQDGHWKHYACDKCPHPC